MAYRYSFAQVASVLLVTSGVILTTLSASKPKTSSSAQFSADSATDHTKTYAAGIGILTLALVLSGFLGMVQDRTFATYTRNAPKGDKLTDAAGQPPAWQESMFYLHMLSMPMFYFLRADLATQFATLNASPTLHLALPTPSQTLHLLTGNSTLPRATSFAAPQRGGFGGVALPSGYVPLLLNTLTQIVCVAGVHRLTSRVSSLTVTLVLVVRKAVSLLISVLLFGARTPGDGRKTMMWAGAALVFLGTVSYSLASRGPAQSVKEKSKRE